MEDFNHIDWAEQERRDNENMQKMLAADPMDQDEGTRGLLDENREFDQGDKADNAIDFDDEDLGDLPEEEEAGVGGSGADGDGRGEGDNPGLTDDMGTSHDTDDLFGDDVSDNEAEHEADGVSHPAAGHGGALLSPESEDLLEMNFPGYSRAGNNQDPSIPAPAESEPELLKQTWPSFVKGDGRILDWNSLIPVKLAHFPGKAPEKPPKPVNPTKVSLDIAPDQEKSFHTAGPATSDKSKRVQEAEARGCVAIVSDDSADEESDGGLDWSIPDPSERLGGVSWTDLEIICMDWESMINPVMPDEVEIELDDWEKDIYQGDERAAKRRKMAAEKDIINAPRFPVPSFDDFEEAAKKSAKRVVIDLNDPKLLVDTLEYSPAKPRRLDTLSKSGKNGVSANLRARYNISNDEAYDALKENHQSKVRATLGNVTLEHSMPAVRLQWPYYRTKLSSKDARSLHRPTLKFAKLVNVPITFSKPLMRKKKQVKGLTTQELFKETKDLTLADHYASASLFEYSEETPLVLSGFGMGNRVINYYRRNNISDTERPVIEDKVGDITTLLPEDRSPFANFGEVESGETVRTLHNDMYRAPIFKHDTKHTDFLVIRSSTGVGGMSWFVRNIDQVYTVGQLFPSLEIPGPHSRRVTNAIKLRMRMIGLRKMKHSANNTLRIGDVTAHIMDSSDMQNRQKLKEFFTYDKVDKVWRLRPGETVPEESTIRSMIKPEEVCALNAMEVGAQRLKDAGFEVTEDKDKTNKNQEKEDEDDPGTEGHLEKSLAPWKTSKAFLDASTGKAMLQLHGAGDPSGHGLAFSMIRTSMKGGYVGALTGPSATSENAIAEAKKANGGHTYNVKKQEELYQGAIADIWNRQKSTLSDKVEYEENDSEREEAAEEERNRFNQASYSAPTPAFDENASMFSGISFNAHPGRVMRITRSVRNEITGLREEVSQIIKDPRVWRGYQKRRHELDAHKTDLYEAKPTGNAEWDKQEHIRYNKHDDEYKINANASHESMKKELARLERNRERRHAREKQKGMRGKSADTNTAGSPSVAATPATEKPTGTSRKCANCGQAGHIKTNKKYCQSHPAFIPDDMQPKGIDSWPDSWT